eukprot:TRINITY_DN3144_c0_g1_i4.p1 TRINITY_DN3144_c0_g1~~TRINITY_DN3144_c0_g1_i4.p1  ORF type:complete len:311 (+),score=46.96 TRINITY_DN3144_c0_g1_i4:68-1000(+)
MAPSRFSANMTRARSKLPRTIVAPIFLVATLAEEQDPEPAVQCENVRNWANGFNCREEGYGSEHGCTERGWTCEGYEHRRFCVDGQLRYDVCYWNGCFGEKLNNPEHNCCACGGGQKNSDEYVEYYDTNPFMSGGKSFMVSEDAPLVAQTVQECQDICTKDAHCSCVTFRRSDGQCQTHATCDNYDWTVANAKDYNSYVKTDALRARTAPTPASEPLEPPTMAPTKRPHGSAQHFEDIEAVEEPTSKTSHAFLWGCLLVIGIGLLGGGVFVLNGGLARRKRAPRGVLLQQGRELRGAGETNDDDDDTALE